MTPIGIFSKMYVKSDDFAALPLLKLYTKPVSVLVWTTALASNLISIPFFLVLFHYSPFLTW